MNKQLSQTSHRGPTNMPQPLHAAKMAPDATSRIVYVGYERVEGVPIMMVGLAHAGNLMVRFYTVRSAQPGDRFKSSTALCRQQMNPDSPGFYTTGTLIVAMQVCKGVLIDSSPFFARLFDPNGLNPQRNQAVVDIVNENVEAIEVYFRVIHDDMSDACYTISIKDVWEVLHLQRIWRFDLRVLNDWFKAWMLRVGGDNFSNFPFEDLNKLILPTFAFDYPEGFAYVTKRLVYETAGRIQEHNPTMDNHLRTDGRIITALNHARHDLSDKLHQGLYIHRKFLMSSCDCKKDGLFAYETALHNTGVWPLAEFMDARKPTSLRTIMDRLDTFTYAPPNNTCPFCGPRYYNLIVQPLLTRVNKLFGGLCLDCMESGERKDTDGNGVRHLTLPSWCDGCRIKHEKHTWYFSWLARVRRDGRGIDTDESS